MTDRVSTELSYNHFYICYDENNPYSFIQMNVCYENFSDFPFLNSTVLVHATTSFGIFFLRWSCFKVKDSIYLVYQTVYLSTSDAFFGLHVLSQSLMLEMCIIHLAWKIGTCSPRLRAF